jgi:hypothetical protein
MTAVVGLGSEVRGPLVQASKAECDGGCAEWLMCEKSTGHMSRTGYPACLDYSEKMLAWHLLGVDASGSGEASSRAARDDFFTSSEHPDPASGPGVLEETPMRYKVSGSAEMADTSLV